MNKKAVSNMIIDIISYLLFVLLIILFLLIISASKNEKTMELNDFTSQTDADYALIAYMRSPVSGESMDFSQLTYLKFIDSDNYKSKWTIKTEEYMKKFYPDCDWDFRRVGEGDKPQRAFDKKSSVQLPGDEKIIVELGLECST